MNLDYRMDKGAYHIMEKRQLGQSELWVNPIGLGCMGFSHAYGRAMDEKEAESIIRDAAAMGYDFFDTAEAYFGTFPDGRATYNEERVGHALRGICDKVVIASKCGVHHNPDKSLRTDSRPEVIRASLEQSLKRLGTDYIDLYYQHRIDPRVEPEEVAGVMADLIKEGKIRYWGISEANEEYLRRANKVCPVTAVQNRYSMMARQHEKLFPVLEELKIAFVAFSPMANGFLTGKYTANSKFSAEDFRRDMPQYTEEGVKKGQELLTMLHDLAAEKQATPGQISLAWILCKKPYLFAIPGSRRRERLEENLQAGEVKLTQAEIAAIDTKLAGMDLLVFTGHPQKK